jgi:predicted transcriptional regulator
MKKVAHRKAAKNHSTAAKGLKKAPLRANAPKASTIRLKPELQLALDAISHNLDRPKNKIVNQAVAEFLEKTSYRLRDDIEETLQNLRAYRSQDPNFEADMEHFVEAEVAHTNEDAHEGNIQPALNQSLTHEIQELIHA